jgi:hypothetical protein
MIHPFFILGDNFFGGEALFFVPPGRTRPRAGF